MRKCAAWGNLSAAVFMLVRAWLLLLRHALALLFIILAVRAQEGETPTTTGRLLCPCPP